MRRHLPPFTSGVGIAALSSNKHGGVVWCGGIINPNPENHPLRKTASTSPARARWGFRNQWQSSTALESMVWVRGSCWPEAAPHSPTITKKGQTRQMTSKDGIMASTARNRLMFCREHAIRRGPACARAERDAVGQRSTPGWPRCVEMHVLSHHMAFINTYHALRRWKFTLLVSTTQIATAHLNTLSHLGSCSI